MILSYINQNLKNHLLCRIVFDNKGIERINLSRLLHDPEVKGSIPSIASKFETPTVIFNRSQTTGSKIFNFNKFVRNLDIDSVVNDNSILPCQCNDSPFSDRDHRHIMTGNLKIIQNNKLRKLFTKGPKYREPKVTDWNEARKCILDGVYSCASKWALITRKITLSS